MFRIGEFSKMTKTTIKALRYYDEVGLLKPEGVDPFTNYRFYTTKQLFVLHQIQAYRQIGLTIDEIKGIRNGASKPDILRKRKSELLAELEAGKEQLSRIEFMLSEKQEGETMKYQAIVKELPECIVYSKEMTVPSYDSYFELVPAIGEEVTKKYPDLKCAVPEYCFIRYLDGEYKEKDFNVEFCEAVTEKKDDFNHIHFKRMPAITAVSIMHKGPYTELAEAYAYAFQWIEENAYLVTESPRENYIDGIWNTSDESEWLTELQIPIARK